MSLTSQEREWLRSASENSAANRQLLKTHSEQIADLYNKTGAHGESITKIGLVQDMCQHRNDTGTKAQRVGIWVAIVVALISALSLLATVLD